MKFLGFLTRGITLLPHLIQGIESAFGKGNGKTKQEKAAELFMLTINSAEFIASKDIVDQDMFAEGLRQCNDGIVKMLNASVHHKG